ncbi:hypothetical protein IAI57_19520 [Stenotrophomonas pavanii]|nr:hypothetical protein IAI57_19520 [Stenotrophomonas pavanii]
MENPCGIRPRRLVPSEFQCPSVIQLWINFRWKHWLGCSPGVTDRLQDMAESMSKSRHVGGGVQDLSALREMPMTMPEQAKPTAATGGSRADRLQAMAVTKPMSGV